MTAKKYFYTEGLNVGYSSPIIKDICLSFDKGEIVTLIGPNGSGKSTILKTITRHLKSMGGAAVLDAQEIFSMPVKDFAKRTAVMMTGKIKTELLTCRDIVSMGRYPYTGRLGVLSDEDNEKIDKAMKTVEVDELSDIDFDMISDGQRQRVLLARALCQEPELIVLDEPTSYLDIRHKLSLLQLLRKMARDEKITVIMSLHEIELAQKISDKIVCVKGDTIFSCGTPDEIFKPEIIETLYDLQSGAFDTIFGSVELSCQKGAPKVFVISGGGTGISVFRKLSRDGISFAAGVLHENDFDFAVANSLASVVISEKAFYPISDDVFLKARDVMMSCERVVVTDFPKGPMNERQMELIDIARQNGLL